MKEYIKPKTNAIMLMRESLLAASETVMFRFSAEVENEWSEDVDKNME